MISCGSQWRRWEPHIHAPGTVLNNQFGGGDPWEEYLSRIEQLTPQVEALAVTDYYLTDTYETVLQHKAAGRLPNVQLIFPNVELRLDAAAKSGFVNVHLLVSPEDPEHLAQLDRILKRLQFHAYSDRFDCTRSELIRLGKCSDPTITNDRIALQHGATQFKVSFKELREVFHESDWAKKNILVAVAGSAGDGTSGVRQAADATVRQEIERFAHVIFSSSAAQREFWLGQRNVPADLLRDRYNGCKPCLHGSDSHDLKSVGQPVDNRYSWIKGGLEFDALRQACIDPDGRAFVGDAPPRSAMPSQVISHVSIGNAAWAQTPEIPLNPGLVAIIGARGSGKTALADIIAAGCNAVAPIAWDANGRSNPSFLARAREVIGEGTVTLTWGGGGTTTQALDGRNANGHLSFPRARYLSQQFVEELCSASGISDGLVDEIERVILEAFPVDEREGAIDFAQFRMNRTSRFRQARNREAEAISELSERIALEHEKESSISTISAQVAQKKSLVENYTADLAKLVVKGTETQAVRHEALRATLQILRERIQVFTNQRRTFTAMQDEVASMRVTKSPELLRQARERHSQSGMSDEQWQQFLLVYKGDVDNDLQGYLTWADTNIAALTGIPVPMGDPNVPLIKEDANLNELNLSVLTAEMARLETLFSADKVVRSQYTALTKRITQETAALKVLEAKLLDAQEAECRRKSLQTEREKAYGRTFQAIISEQTALGELYEPLMRKLAESSGTLGKLGFAVRRIVNVARWASFAEETLLDRRKTGPFNGRGSLLALTQKILQPVWESGSANDIRNAMTAFIAEYGKDLLLHAPVVQTPAEYRAWLKQFAHWLFATDHIEIRYEIVYDNIDIRKLSPGTRGIVLLLLYLALDESDDRPLIIDQPEENLDPKSVFDELVTLFITAKVKRQVILVTHNANLVINTDADQIIVAEAGPHQAGALPPITYKAGGLENIFVRKAVCDILEGGDSAFRERARRLRVRLER